MQTTSIQTLPQQRASSELLLHDADATSLARALQAPSEEALAALEQLERTLRHFVDCSLQPQIRHLRSDQDSLDLMSEPVENRLLAEALGLGEQPLPEAALYLPAEATDAEQGVVALALGGLLITPSQVGWMSLAEGEVPAALLHRVAPAALEALRGLIEPELGQLYITASGHLLMVGREWRELQGLHPRLLPGLHLPDFEPQGGSARLWRRLQQEIQMVWHGQESLRALAADQGLSSLILAPWGAGPAKTLPGADWLQTIRGPVSPLQPGVLGWLAGWSAALATLTVDRPLLVADGAKGLVVSLAPVPAAVSEPRAFDRLKALLGLRQSGDLGPTPSPTWQAAESIRSRYPLASRWIAELIEPARSTPSSRSGSR